jgi:hypothetical protein
MAVNLTRQGRGISGPRDEPPYARYAFLNAYNLSLFFGFVGFGLLSGHSWAVVLTCAAETLWMIFAPDSTILRSLWFDPAFARAERAAAEERCQAKVASLGAADRARFTGLAAQKTLIERLARDNRSLTVDLLRPELDKLDALFEEFAHLGLNASRAEAHLAAFDMMALQRTYKVQEAQAAQHPHTDPRHAIAEKNLSILRQRRARYDDIAQTIQIERGQMELIEQTFRLLADEIMTMTSPLELGGRIDELRIAVDAIRETAGETLADDDDLATNTACRS